MNTELEHQISADQILKEVYERRKVVKPSTKVDILDLEELKEHQRRKRAEFEGYLKRNRLDVGQWIRYGLFELKQHDVRRARSVFERALLVSNTYIPLWIRYIDAELKLKCINHARNLLNRAVSTLPRVDKLWYKYLLMEESLGNVEIVRSLFNKWISLEPNPNAWNAFIDYEIRQEKRENARDIYSRYVMVHPKADTWLKWVNFESIYGDPFTVRRVYSLAVDTLVSFQNDSSNNDLTNIIIAFANWETMQQEYERSRALYNLSIKKWPENKILQDSMVEFEKKFGSVTSTEQSVVHKRRRRYEELLKKNARDYDTWWLYLDIMQENFQQEFLSSLEKSIMNNQPQELTKSLAWKQYVYLWIRCLTYLELEAGNIDLCRNLYKRLLNEVIPHKHFTFSKMWLMYSQFEIRQKNLSLARKILGKSLGLCPKRKTYEGYIEMEIKLKQFDRVRKLYEKYIEFDPFNLDSWIKYAELEENLGDEERSRGIYEIALFRNPVDLPQNSRMTLMQGFIQFETDAEEFEKARELYERYLEISGNSVKVWVEYALYESSTPTGEQLRGLQAAAADIAEEEEEIEFQITDENRFRSREIFERALKHFKQKGDKENRIVILEAYSSFESTYGSTEAQAMITKRMPQVVEKGMADGCVQRDYIFPDDIEETPNASKFLAFAKKWNDNRRN